GALAAKALEPLAVSPVQPLADALVARGALPLDPRAPLPLCALPLLPLTLEPIREGFASRSEGDQFRIARAEAPCGNRLTLRSLIGDAFVPREPHTAGRSATSEALELLHAPLFAVIEANLDEGEYGHEDREERDHAEGEVGDHLVVGASVDADPIRGQRAGGQDQQRAYGDEWRQEKATGE